MNARFANKVAVVTGAASGIGLACARLLLDQGAQVVATDADEQALHTSLDNQQSTNLLLQPCDVTSRQATEACIAETVEHFGQLDILINSAGISRRNVPADADFEQAWDRVMEVNLKGSMLMCHAAVPAMTEHGTSGGSIVNLGSIMSFAVYQSDYGLSDGFNPYPHSKGAVLSLIHI